MCASYAGTLCYITTDRQTKSEGRGYIAHPNSTFLSSIDTPMFLPEVLASMAPFLHSRIS